MQLHLSSIGAVPHEHPVSFLPNILVSTSEQPKRFEKVSSGQGEWLTFFRLKKPCAYGFLIYNHMLCHTWIGKNVQLFIMPPANRLFLSSCARTISANSLANKVPSHFDRLESMPMHMLHLPPRPILAL